jgi:uncharacterized membrane protein
MKSIISIILMTFEGEFTKIHNVLGWLLTSSVWVLTNIDHINNILTAVLTLCSIVWVVVKIVLAFKDRHRN